MPICAAGCPPVNFVSMIWTLNIRVYICDMKKTRKRPYRMHARAESARNTEQRILAAMVTLWMQKSLTDITLDDVAAAAGVTVRTVIRKYENKDGLVDASIVSYAKDMQLIRNARPHRTWQDAVQALLEEYETNGDAVMRTLAIEHEFPAAARIAQHGREQHAQWCAKEFSAVLPRKNAAGYAPKLLAVRTATDIYLWKLLRRDLGHSLQKTRSVMIQLIQGVLNT